VFAADAQRRAADSHAEAADAGGTSVRAPAIPKSERAVRAKGMEADISGLKWLDLTEWLWRMDP
jgi:hypothetical protein